MTFLGLLRQWDRANPTSYTYETEAAVEAAEAEEQELKEAATILKGKEHQHPERTLEKPQTQKTSQPSSSKVMAGSPSPAKQYVKPDKTGIQNSPVHKPGWAKQQMKAYAGWTNYFLARGDTGEKLFRLTQVTFNHVLTNADVRVTDAGFGEELMDGVELVLLIQVC